MPVSGSILGNPVQRVEDPRILHGEARYFDDLPVEGLGHVVFVRSTVAHAKVTGIDTGDAEAALAEGAPVLFPDHGSNEAIAFNFGEDETVLEGADVVIEGHFVNQRIAAVPMEPNGILVELDGDRLVVHVPTQAPFGVRDQLAALVGLEPEDVRVVAPAVGGGFGAKTGCYPEFVVVAVAARALGRPLK